ncbi:PREDICTED: translation initiation factor IF-2-like [Rhagoletis zephyria]|uniref:translation initiation factor IF-2-like n=1 Tax=Rhagoletis zephyria TaxID=28612 RepID=UPI0008115399|nr:PREDICTED: translation initiation factor IF-2-like [Rhagoletis zephyria]XP_036322133.1 translation initiation factor IF-2-like [Rhagoletis pomonella]
MTTTKNQQQNKNKTRNTNSTKAQAKVQEKSKGTKQEERRKIFLEGLSDAEAALFLEHAREDNEPSTRSGIFHERALRDDSGHETTSGSGRRRYHSESSRGQTRSPSQSGSTTSRDSLKNDKGRHLDRRANPPTLPPAGKPGSLTDPRRLGLSGSGARHYVRYIEQRKTPEVARELALARSAPQGSSKRDSERYTSTTAPANERKSGHQKQTRQYGSREQTAPAAGRKSGHTSECHKPAPAEKRSDGQHLATGGRHDRHTGETAPAYKRKSGHSRYDEKHRNQDNKVEGSGETAPAKRKSGQLTPNTPAPKKQREYLSPPTS